MSEAQPTIVLLGRDDGDVLRQIAQGVFDQPINTRFCEEFLNDSRHHLAVAIESEIVVGMASAMHYLHPDKEPELFISEVAVSPAYQNRGLGKRLIEALLKVGQQIGCSEAWVLTDRSNTLAMRLYASCGGIEGPRDQVMFSFKL